MVDIPELLGALINAGLVFFIARKILRNGGILGFMRHVRERESASDDLLLAALGLTTLLEVAFYAALLLDPPVPEHSQAQRLPVFWTAYHSGKLILTLFIGNGGLTPHVRRILRWGMGRVRRFRTWVHLWIRLQPPLL